MNLGRCCNKPRKERLETGVYRMAYSNHGLGKHKEWPWFFILYTSHVSTLLNKRKPQCWIPYTRNLIHSITLTRTPRKGGENFPHTFPYIISLHSGFQEGTYTRKNSIDRVVSPRGPTVRTQVISWFSLLIKEILLSRRFEQTIVYTSYVKVRI